MSSRTYCVWFKNPSQKAQEQHDSITLPCNSDLISPHHWLISSVFCLIFIAVFDDTFFSILFTSLHFVYILDTVYNTILSELL